MLFIAVKGGSYIKFSLKRTQKETKIINVTEIGYIPTESGKKELQLTVKYNKPGAIRVRIYALGIGKEIPSGSYGVSKEIPKNVILVPLKKKSTSSKKIESIEITPEEKTLTLVPIGTENIFLEIGQKEEKSGKKEKKYFVTLLFFSEKVQGCMNEINRNHINPHIASNTLNYCSQYLLQTFAGEVGPANK